jgi:hypothetical protein
MTVAIAEWLVAVLVVGACAVLAVAAVRLNRPVLGLASLIPALTGIVLHAGGIRIAPPAHAWVVVLSFGVAIVGVLAGSPLSTWVFRITDPSASVSGPGGGILVPPSPSSVGPQREILRGGATIGYLERLAIIGAMAVGRVEIIAAVIAIKGLGRFTELSTSEARERFIIGSLVSMMWAVLCGALIWVPGR